jgi:hypothetical protein
MGAQLDDAPIFDERLRKRYAPASTGWLVVSIFFANKLWILDVTLMSLYWVARLPIERPKKRASALEPDASSTGTTPSVSVPFVPARRKRQWKLALSFAVVAAFAAPFVFGSYKMRPRVYVVPLTAQERADLVTSVKRCGNDWSPQCASDRLTLRDGRYLRRDDLQYLGVNAVIALLTFVCVFVLAYLVPILTRGLAFLVRRYWQWLNA